MKTAEQSDKERRAAHASRRPPTKAKPELPGIVLKTPNGSFIKAKKIEPDTKTFDDKGRIMIDGAVAHAAAANLDCDRYLVHKDKLCVAKDDGMIILGYAIEGSFVKI